MDPHETEAKAAVSLIKDFYGSVDSTDKRKSFTKQYVFAAGESSNELDQDLPAVGAKIIVQI
jgi:hypothetical protein